MFTLGHFPTACCIILILVWPKIPWLDCNHNTLSVSGCSLGLDHRQRSLQLVKPAECALEAELSLINFSCSWASLQFSLIKLSLRWLVSLQYWDPRLGFSDSSAPSASWDGQGFPRRANNVPYPTVPNPPLAKGCDLTFRLVVTVWLIALPNIIGSRSPLNCSFWACRLLSWVYCLSILFCCHLEFFDSLLPVSFLVYIYVDACRGNLTHPPNIVTRHPQNLVNVSSSGEDCNALQAMAA